MAKRAYKRKSKSGCWLKEIAPTTGLRKWFSHDPEKWGEFRKKYLQELKENKSQVAILKEYLKKGTATLVYGAKDQKNNEAQVLEELINR